MISIGLDLSLAATGVCVIKNGTTLFRGLVKSKPTPDGTPTDELMRLLRIVGEIESILDEHCPDNTADVVVIEGLAFMARNTTALVQLAGLNYFVRQIVYKAQVPFAIVAPSSLKKFITGKGIGDKNIILLEIYKRYGETILDDNEADAFGLAQLGQAILGGHKGTLIVPQLEVVELVKKQLNERSNSHT